MYLYSILTNSLGYTNDDSRDGRSGGGPCAPVARRVPPVASLPWSIDWPSVGYLYISVATTHDLNGDVKAVGSLYLIF